MDMAQRLYAALAAFDAASLRGLLADDFRAELTPGLPWHLGEAPIVGAEHMLRYGWGRVAREFDMVPRLDEVYVVDDWAITRGRYVGRARATGLQIDAWFAHFWKADGARFVWLRQVTDTVAWWAALDIEEGRERAGSGPDTDRDH
jgi:ketosteroid isomerase-like protein